MTFDEERKQKLYTIVRRRVEDNLRKTEDKKVIIEVAKLLKVKIPRELNT